MFLAWSFADGVVIRYVMYFQFRPLPLSRSQNPKYATVPVDATMSLITKAFKYRLDMLQATEDHSVADAKRVGTWKTGTTGQSALLLNWWLGIHGSLYLWINVWVARHVKNLLTSRLKASAMTVKSYRARNAIN